MERSRAAARASIVLLLAMLAAGCAEGERSIPVFTRTADDSLGFRPLPPGTRYGLLFLFLENRSDSAVAILDVELRGTGLDREVRVIRTDAMRSRGGRGSLPSGTYLTDPPAWYSSDERACHVGRLEPLAGFVLGPQGEMRVWLVVELVRPGTYEITGFTVRYRLGDSVGHQTLPTGFEGVVKEGATEVKLEPDERRCLSETTLIPQR
jgi:hypothetical protein